MDIEKILTKDECKLLKPKSKQFMNPFNVKATSPATVVHQTAKRVQDNLVNATKGTKVECKLDYDRTYFLSHRQGKATRKPFTTLSNINGVTPMKNNEKFTTNKINNFDRVTTRRSMMKRILVDIDDDNQMARGECNTSFSPRKWKRESKENNKIVIKKMRRVIDEENDIESLSMYRNLLEKNKQSFKMKGIREENERMDFMDKRILQDIDKEREGEDTALPTVAIVSEKGRDASVDKETEEIAEDNIIQMDIAEDNNNEIHIDVKDNKIMQHGIESTAIDNQPISSNFTVKAEKFTSIVKTKVEESANTVYAFFGKEESTDFQSKKIKLETEKP